MNIKVKKKKVVRAKTRTVYYYNLSIMTEILPIQRNHYQNTDLNVTLVVSDPKFSGEGLEIGSVLKHLCKHFHK